MKRIKPSGKSFTNFSIFLIIVLLQCDPSLAQICSVACTQKAIVRNRPYQEAFEIVQNREWENEDDFGDDLGDLIRRHKRVKRTGEEHFEENRALEEPRAPSSNTTTEKTKIALEDIMEMAAAFGLIGMSSAVSTKGKVSYENLSNLSFALFPPKFEFLN